MAKAVMGIDFLGLEDGNAAATSQPGKSSTMTGVPMASKRAAPAAPPAAAGARRRGDDLLFLSPRPSAPQLRLIPRFLAQMPVRNPAAPSGSAAETSPASAGGGAAAPLTIFYNGTVATFHLPPDKAEAIINWTDRTTQPRARRMERPAVAVVDNTGRRPPPQHFSLDKIGSTDLPLARKRSLQRFLEKRNER